jgi:hypothetical protein
MGRCGAAACVATCVLAAHARPARAQEPLAPVRSAPTVTFARAGVTAPAPQVFVIAVPAAQPAGIGSTAGRSDAPRFQASDPPEAGGTPDLEPARIAGQLIVGAYSGIGGYFVGSWAGAYIADALPTESQSTIDNIGLTFGVVGATLATAGGVAAVGNIGDQTGSYSAALAGTAGGVVAGILINQLVYGHARLPSGSGSSKRRWVEASLEALLPSLGATIAFNSSRRFK